MYCGGCVVFDHVCLVGQFVKHSLQVREVVEVGRTGVGPVRDSL
jgi:hypothetical protein